MLGERECCESSFLLMTSQPFARTPRLFARRLSRSRMQRTVRVPHTTQARLSAGRDGSGRATVARSNLHIRASSASCQLPLTRAAGARLSSLVLRSAPTQPTRCLRSGFLPSAARTSVRCLATTPRESSKPAAGKPAADDPVANIPEELFMSPEEKSKAKEKRRVRLPHPVFRTSRVLARAIRCQRAATVLSDRHTEAHRHVAFHIWLLRLHMVLQTVEDLRCCHQVRTPHRACTRRHNLTRSAGSTYGPVRAPCSSGSTSMRSPSASSTSVAPTDSLSPSRWASPLLSSYARCICTPRSHIFPGHQRYVAASPHLDSTCSAAEPHE